LYCHRPLDRVGFRTSPPYLLFNALIECSANTGQREAGCLEAIKKFPDIQVILDNRYSGSSISEAQSTASAMLDKLKEADGIFCSNEPTTFGMLLALRQNSLAGSKKFVGFDTSPALVEGLKRGEIQALLFQSKDIQWSWVSTTVALKQPQSRRLAADSGKCRQEPNPAPTR